MSEMRYMDREGRQRLFYRFARLARFDIQKMASLCQISIRQLERYISVDYGRTLHEWLTEQRMIAAVQLLVEAQSVKQVSLTLGFSRPTNFSREFRRVHGLSPRLFLRRRHQTNHTIRTECECPYLASRLRCPFQENRLIG